MIKMVMRNNGQVQLLELGCKISDNMKKNVGFK
jgi:hypothetical protein